MNKKLITAFALMLSAQMVSAEAPKIVFQDAKSPTDVFAVKNPGQASFIYSYMPYLDWAAKQSGKSFPMEVAPVVSGMVDGKVQLPAPQPIDENQFNGQPQAKEFAHVVNVRNLGGRSELEAAPGKAGVPPAKLLAEELKTTYVVQTVMSGVVNRPIASLGLSTEKFFSLVKAVDADHSHFRIAGGLVLNALEKDHIAARSINPNGAYLLSVFDFRDYGCPTIKNNLRDHFSGLPEKQRLMNESLYIISDLQMNVPADLDEAQKFFGKRPTAVLTQNVIFADHLIRGAKTIFVFFEEGENTRIVLLSNIAMRSKYFTGAQGILKRQLILDGPNGAFGGLGGAALATKSAGADLLAGADQDVSEKNTCERGLGLGLIKYSKSLYSSFAGFLAKP
ncbi:MAG: hypothetical protein ACXVA9_12560 [Bdellovibrionales bacterium]